MNRQTRHLAGAFAAMVFVGASWGANLPVTKVMLGYFDLMPMAAVRTAAATAALAVLLWAVEGRRALRIDLPLGRFLALGLMMAAFFACYALGIHLSNPITAAAVGIAGPLVSAATVWLVTRQAFDPGFGIALAGSRHFNLQETLVDAILDLCLAQPGVIEARVSTEKPDVYKDCRVGYEAVRRK